MKTFNLSVSISARAVVVKNARDDRIHWTVDNTLPLGRWKVKERKKESGVDILNHLGGVKTVSHTEINEIGHP